MFRRAVGIDDVDFMAGNGYIAVINHKVGNGVVLEDIFRGIAAVHLELFTVGALGHEGTCHLKEITEG